ncbi:MAG: enoyl-CoA hydratase [Bacteroidota bacterium]
MLTTTVQNRVLHVVFDRPAKKNALTSEMYAGVTDTLNRAEAEEGIRAVVLRGSGGNFTAGNDLMEFAMFSQLAGSIRDTPVVGSIHRILSFEKPLIAAVHGLAVGWGVTVLMHCDAVLASDSARFSVPFTKLGLVPEFGSSYLLPRLAGDVRARHLLMTGGMLNTEEAVRLGLVSQTTTDDALEADAQALGETFANLPTGALLATKRLLRTATGHDRLKQAVEEELDHFEAGLRSEDHREAIMAFMEKRSPRFS